MRRLLSHLIQLMFANPTHNRGPAEAIRFSNIKSRAKPRGIEIWRDAAHAQSYVENDKLSSHSGTTG